MNRKKITIRTLKELHSNNTPIVCLTSYDAQMAKIVDEAGVDLILVGDSLGMTVLGFDTTLPVTVDMMIHHTSAVCRGNKTAFVVGDMPFLSYGVSDAETISNAALFLQKAGSDAVKLEGGENMAPLISKMVNLGIPVMGHIGLLPQSVIKEGGYRKYGKTSAEAKQLIKDAKALEKAGVFAIVLEGVSDEVTKQITGLLDIPTIGIASGPSCSGQIQVVNDILGLFTTFIPKHSKQYVNGAELFQAGIGQYVKDLKSAQFFGNN
ncbi:MAG: 3-methyl-2-oxobutanoate hydroxymethyltransferase [Lentisphaeria bacterium]|nr:3-methyl-2-oxobutanoate hydroxymethyltransferase [Lentisphaeria bacterium]